MVRFARNVPHRRSVSFNPREDVPDEPEAPEGTPQTTRRVLTGDGGEWRIVERVGEDGKTVLMVEKTDAQGRTRLVHAFT